MTPSQASFSRAYDGPYRPVSGFTLVELMVAMLLGMVVIAGVTSVFLAGQRSFRTNHALAEVQDSSRIAFEQMARDIRDAGLTGCNSINGRIGNLLKNQDTAWWANWGNAVHGYDQAGLDPALTGIATASASASSLQLLGAGNDPTITSGNYDGSAAQLTLAAATTPIVAGDIVMVCTPGSATIFQADAYAKGTGVLTFKADSGSPGNSSVFLGYPAGDLCTKYGPASMYCFPPNSLVSKLTAVDWYVGANTAGGTSLYRLALTTTVGVPTPTAQEMVRGVTGMTITYLNPDVTAIASQYVNAATISSNNGWAGVTAVRVALDLSSTAGRVSVKGDQPIARTYAFTTNLRNRVN